MSTQKVMKLVDKNIELAACGSFEQNASDMKWNQVVVEKTGGHR